jgi:hypothetical protein
MRSGQGTIMCFFIRISTHLKRLLPLFDFVEHGLFYNDHEYAWLEGDLLITEFRELFGVP